MVPFLLFIAVLASIFFGMPVQKSLPMRPDYLSPSNTTVIKGIFVLIVFMSHIRGYMDFPTILDQIAFFVPRGLGQMMVIPFLFYSGYGIMESIEKKGRSYVRSIPYKRFLKVYLHFSIAVLFYVLLSFVQKESLSWKEVLLSLMGWTSLGNSNWFIFISLIMYLFTWLCFSIFLNHKTFASLAVLGCAFILVLCLGYFKLKPEYWYDTAIFFPLGLLYSRFKAPIERIFSQNKLWIPAVLTNAALLLLFFFWSPAHFLALQAKYVLFCTMLVLLTMRFTFKNRLLNWLGNHVFSIYILQRLPMSLFVYVGVREPNLYFSLCLASTILLSLGFDFLLNKLDSKLFSNREYIHGTA